MMLSKAQTDEIFGKYGIELTDEQYSRLAVYSDLLVEWNEKINLTAITDSEGITVKHFFDSIYPFTLFELKEGSSLIDVGTGAGFPSCPLKIYRDDIKLTLLDSLNKRVNFLKELSEKAQLDAQCIHGRAEEAGRNADLREQFDCACARAVANLTELSEYCLPFVKKGGIFAALKGSGGEEELEEARNAIKILGGKVEKAEKYSLPNGDGRTLIIIRKVASTPPKYPRNKGQMKKRPLRTG
ncbi:16S rRNA (guanine(527)-N(7))-methyltransferase RsmG [uncultured Ruminococcus sp.]|uniref:16S rRNA (guanine(527)-N(7))-methyltransferase RsmG n=1 Tax=uncultured Ruminococcus sp. TaxID=165186 RepID=UPI0025ECC241|nr:16S rRNA (guanine(527)-N(7))-methyltransferase RsmG [uncultured Ruminococcus sp.]